MGLRSRIRRSLLARGYRVPGFLVREHDRLFHEVVHSLRPGMVVLDIGANRGDIAAAFAARGATVHAFEPNPDVFAELRKAARAHPTIHAQNCGILDADAEMKLYLHESYADDPLGHSESSSFVAAKPNVSADDFRSVPVRDIAGVIAEIGVPIDVVKIDVEGAEYRILKRMIETGTIERVGRVYVETHHDRIPELRAEHEAVAAAIAERGLGGKIRLDWV
ncbi:MAG TPA: FkbM family methyltransferase [Amaricoccus sp.]|uniref:FkbM family methyltransferase n=1 Tax=Amaricoccus sp. TaxID=1872485 RepID=UPI002C5EFFA7|nr:FkbM family methyltransferase [Amaricoccus sp.]HMQ91846.1 FkbM family methyltransferase [Amaricoccus sp.]HMR53431.1 FkbM family methyltransferase [Amaricoccus sp.]HMR61218.1 FkbM family methyltransferase [Amaricoccus sp.]HMU00372.1 FkbM family methyltransferase [Amaricoccus sp.]